MNCKDNGPTNCAGVSCLHPKRCKHYGTDHKPYLNLLREVREIPGIKRVYINSGIHSDLAALDDEFVEELAAHHTPGHQRRARAREPDALSKMKARDRVLLGVHGPLPQSQRSSRSRTVPGAVLSVCTPRYRPRGLHRACALHEGKRTAPRQVQMFMPTQPHSPRRCT